MDVGEFDQVNSWITSIYIANSIIFQNGMPEIVVTQQEQQKKQSWISFREWAKSGGNVNSHLPNKNTLLQHTFGMYPFTREIWEWFLDELKADPNLISTAGQVPLQTMLALPNIESSDVVNLLLKGADPNLRCGSGYGNFPPIFACCQKHIDNPEFIALLIAHGADINAEVENLGTALHFACLTGAQKAAKYILNQDSFDLFKKCKMDGRMLSAAEALFAYCLTDCVYDLIKKTSGAQSMFDLTQVYTKAVNPHLSDVSLDGVHLVPANWFMEQGCFPHYNVCLEAGVLETPNNILDLGSKLILFVSHRWDAVEHPDPRGDQFRCLKTFVGQTSKTYDYIWADFSCICQHLGSPLFLKNLANIPTAVFLSTDVLVIPKRDTKILTSDVEGCHAKGFEVRYSNLKDYTDRGWCELEAFLCLITGCSMHISFNIFEEEFFDEVTGGTQIFGGSSNVIAHYTTLLQSTNDSNSHVAWEDVPEIWGWRDYHRGTEPLNYKEPSQTMRAGVLALQNSNLGFLQKVFSMSLVQEELEGEVKAAYSSFGDLASEDDRITLLRFSLCVLGFTMGYIDINGQISVEPFLALKTRAPKDQFPFPSEVAVKMSEQDINAEISVEPFLAVKQLSTLLSSELQNEAETRCIETSESESQVCIVT